MSDFGADVFEQDPKGPKRGTPQPDRPVSLPANETKAAPIQASPASQRAVPALGETPHGSEAAARPPAPANLARPREARPARELERHGRFEPSESRWREDPQRIPSQPPREPEHQRAPSHRRNGPPDQAPPKERHTEFRSHHEPAEPRPQRERTAAREPVRPIERNTPRPASAPQTVGLLVDLEGLQAEARAQQGELAMHRLRSGLGSGRTVAKALAIAKNAGAAPSGFDLIVSSGGFAAGVQFAAAAVDLLRVAPVLVMAPTSEPIRKLAGALRAAGHTVELAGFAATEASARRLGRDCLFVP
jgi:hypothetical protein